MQSQPRFIVLFAAWLCAGVLGPQGLGAGEPAAGGAAMARPKLVKLPFAYPDGMENTPVVFNGRPMMVGNHRPGGLYAKGADAYLLVVDLTTGQEVARFGKGHSFVSALANGAELNVFATEFVDYGAKMDMRGINRFTTTDLKTWKQETAIPQTPGEQIFNSSVCRDERGYVMAYELMQPVQFCFKFARSKDLAQWEKVSGLIFTGEKNEYSACPVIRYFAPYYYVIYLHAAIPGHDGWISFLARSKDLESWDLSPMNPILEASAGEGINNSDVDLLELEGSTYLFYATGDQQTWASVRVAQYAGPMKEFFEKWFPAGSPMARANAKRL
ncbi:MAG: hypothetical protein NTW96_07000 [Planctomycetia bacterium]|nr:hypothetical protein [Planctomycetia bacterium]